MHVDSPYARLNLQSRSRSLIRVPTLSPNNHMQMALSLTMTLLSSVNAMHNLFTLKLQYSECDESCMQAEE